MNNLAMVILAAGGSRRFGQSKQLADINGMPMLQRVVDQCLQVKFQHLDLESIDLFVALGAYSDQIQASVEFGRARVVFNPDWSDGIGATIASVTSQLEKQYGGLMFVAGDQPLIHSARLSAMIQYWRQNPDLVCCANYDNVFGIPAIFPGRLFPQLQALQGDRGAKQLLLAERGKLQTFALPEAKTDIDRPDDLRNIPN
jgi:molybdenum cofactor cytidylyltransferase